MRRKLTKRFEWGQAGSIVGVVGMFWLLASLLQPAIGYHAVGIVFLMAVVLSGTFLSRSSVFIIACLLSLIHNYFFIPPLHTFMIREPQDALMYLLFFLAASSLGLHETRRRLEVLEQADRLSRTFFDSVSHELKTPLTTIKGAASALASPSGENTEDLVKDLAGQIGAETERLLAVVDNMLDMTRLESGALTPRIDTYDIADVLGPSLNQIEPAREGRKIHTKIAADVRPIKCDASLVVQALANILHNSIVHSRGIGDVEVDASNTENGSVEIRIRDEGPGIPVDNPNVVFQKFFRRPDRRGGLGLGLSIAKGFIEVQGGSVTAANAPDRGAIFTVRLPAG